MPTRSRADGQSETWNAPEKVSPVSNLALKLPSIPRGLPSGAVATCVRWTDPETALAVVPGPQPPNTLKATAASFVPGSRKRGPSISYVPATVGGMTFPFEVTVSDADAKGDSLVHALGRNAAVTFTVNGLFMGPSVSGGHIDASFSARYADGSGLRGTFNLSPADLSTGR